MFIYENVFIIILLALSFPIFKGEHSVNHINIYGHWDKEKKSKWNIVKNTKTITKPLRIQELK